MLSVLFVEDNQSTVAPVLNLIEREHADIKCELTTFNGAQDQIELRSPDIVVLDLVQGDVMTGRDYEGRAVHALIWDKHFCPIVVYSAWSATFDEDYGSHPFVRSIQKGTRSEIEVLQALEDFRPHVEALKEAERHVRQSFSEAMREVAPYAFSAFSDPDRQVETIKRSGRRRLAAFMDGLSREGEGLASWEQYLCPPICEDTQLGDILRAADASDGPESFRLVLSPSCDLVSSGGRKPKVEKALVARCISVQEALSRAGLSPQKNELEDDKKLDGYRERLRKTVLSQGYYRDLILLPFLAGKIPSMAANLKELELVSLDDIGSAGKPFLRVASIDSPFRELVSWAYMQMACRPGLPERDLESWGEELLVALREGEEE